MRSDPTLKKWYKKINKRFFDNQLTNNVCVRWANEDDTDEDERCEEKYAGWANFSEEGPHKYIIVISRDLKKSKCTRLHTLIHEMCHLATDLKDEHGPAFSAWHEHLTARGIFKKGALLKGLTIF